MIAARIVEPRSKLATIRGLKEETATTSLSLELDIEGHHAKGTLPGT